MHDNQQNQTQGKQMKKIIFAVLVSIFTFKSYAVSFDCNKAATLVENVICSDEEISALDDALASSYANVLASSDDAGSIKLEQRNWLKKRNACQNKACLKTLYTQRIQELTRSKSASKETTNDQAGSDALPKKPGDCMDSTLLGKATRFEGAVAGQAGGEVFVQVTKDIHLYVQTVPNFPASESIDAYMYSTPDFVKGDKISLCLLELPRDCPPGDERGKIYSVTNIKNNKSFVGIDAWHICGGA